MIAESAIQMTNLEGEDGPNIGIFGPEVPRPVDGSRSCSLVAGSWEGEQVCLHVHSPLPPPNHYDDARGAIRAFPAARILPLLRGVSC